MKKINFPAICVFFCLCFSCVFAEPPLYKSRDLTIESSRQGEGNYQVILTRKSGRSEVIWKSFFGNVSVKVSSDEQFIALLDTMRFNVMSPVVIYRIEADSAVPIYQTPCKFTDEDTAFTYKMGDFGKDEFEVLIFRTDITRTPNDRQVFSFSYHVNNLKHRLRAVPYFYMNVSDIKEYGELPEVSSPK